MAVYARTVMKTVQLESFIQRDILDKSFNRSGLCAYCTRKVTCCLNDSCGLVHDCEDYDAGDDSSCSLTFTTLDMCSLDDDDAYGLCAQCQKRDLCQLKLINGGVWHCEEYQ